ncbi:MAG: S8 family serine peptidase [Opitutales bacterium]|nr:S8 family serine peptidase [Opitutales bacterium]
MKHWYFRFPGLSRAWRAVGFTAAAGILLVIIGRDLPDYTDRAASLRGGAHEENVDSSQDSGAGGVDGDGSQEFSFGDISLPAPLALADRYTVLIDKRTTVLSPANDSEQGALERVALWGDVGTGERVRSVQWFAAGAEEAVDPEPTMEALMAADYFIVSPVAATGWEALDAVLEAGGWSISRRHPGSRVARVTAPLVFEGGLDGLETALIVLQNKLPKGYLSGWTHFLEPALVPNDTEYPQQWAPGVIDAPSAWTRTTGSSDIVVAVIDTGVDYNHPDLRPNMWSNPHEAADGTDTSGNGFVDDIRGWDFAGNTNDPRDVSSHGTGVAGVLGAVGNNAFGIAGVAWSVRMMPLAVGSSNIPVDRIVDAIDYAIWQREEGGQNVVAVNISLGGRMPDVGRDEETPLFLAVRRARDAGILGVFAAGNDGLNNDAPVAGRPNHFFPSDIDLENVLSVASTTSADNLYSTSNFGPESVNLAAPGHMIRTPFPGDGFLNQTGTSFAAPHVSGAVALVYASNPHLLPGDVRAAVINGSTPLVSLEGKLANPVRLSLGGVLDEAARWPRVLSTAAWTALPFLRSIDPEPLPVVVEIEGDTVETVTFVLDEEVFAADSGESLEWSVSWNPPGPGEYAWRVLAESAEGRAVEAEMPPVGVLAPYPYWQATQFGVNYEKAVNGFDPQSGGGAGWTLAERFVFGLGIDAAIQPSPPATVPEGRVTAFSLSDNETIELRFWQSTDSLFVPLTVQSSHGLGAVDWDTVDAAETDILENHPETGRVLRRVAVPAPDAGAPRFYRLRFDLEP